MPGALFQDDEQRRFVFCYFGLGPDHWAFGAGRDRQDQ
jgi:hypothetical protein